MTRRPRGSILVLVLAVLAMLGILGASLSRMALHRVLQANAIRDAERRATAARTAHGGETSPPHATIGSGANGAPSNE